MNAYRGVGADGDTLDLADLIRLIRDIDGIDRIRYTTSHPVEFSDSLIQVYEDVPELVSHLHLPVQSGSDRILAMMKRNHMVLEYKSKLRKLKRIRPDISFSSDFIIGFRGKRPGLRGHHESDPRHRLRHVFQLHLQRPSGYPGGRPA